MLSLELCDITKQVESLDDVFDVRILPGSRIRYNSASCNALAWQLGISLPDIRFVCFIRVSSSSFVASDSANPDFVCLPYSFCRDSCVVSFRSEVARDPREQSGLLRPPADRARDDFVLGGCVDVKIVEEDKLNWRQSNFAIVCVFDLVLDLSPREFLETNSNFNFCFIFD